MTTALAQKNNASPAPQSIEAALQQIEKVAAGYMQTVANPNVGRLAKMIATGESLRVVRDLLTNERMNTYVMPLMNSQLGFKTDKTKVGDRYGWEDVREVVVAALLNNVYPYNNEFNIISGNLYITKEGYERKVREIKGLADLQVIPGVPALRDGRTVIRMSVTWKLDGIPQQICDQEGKPGRVFVIRVNAGGSDDATIGKATRKALKAAYQQICGSDQLLPDGDTDDEPAKAQGELPLGRNRIE